MSLFKTVQSNLENISDSAKERFRGYMPVVVDLETGGLIASEHALLQVGVVCLDYSKKEGFSPGDAYQWDVKPHPKTKLDKQALSITGIDPHDPNREALDEKEVLESAFSLIQEKMELGGFDRAVMVAHNASFDLSFLTAAMERSKIQNSPFHPFTTLDTAALSQLSVGHNVLLKACQRFEIPFDTTKAHNALYDAHQTAKLFCNIVNVWGMAFGVAEDKEQQG